MCGSTCDHTGHAAIEPALLRSISDSSPKKHAPPTPPSDPFRVFPVAVGGAPTIGDSSLETRGPSWKLPPLHGPFFQGHHEAPYSCPSAFSLP